ncbi:MAG: hypothetical protein H0T75_02420 [Rhizobiales bacterium]|nr:hypothetical protein [Hyphomicrobiales bacterium]
MSVHFYREPLRAAVWPPPLSRWLAGLRPAKTQKLDIESLSDHLRRDLGLAGGRASPPRDIFRD